MDSTKFQDEVRGRLKSAFDKLNAFGHALRKLEARVHELELARGDLKAERDTLAVSLRVMVNNLDASMTRVAELETALGEVLGEDVWDFGAALAEGSADVDDVERWRATLKG